MIVADGSPMTDGITGCVARSRQGVSCAPCVGTGGTLSNITLNGIAVDCSGTCEVLAYQLRRADSLEHTPTPRAVTAGQPDHVGRVHHASMLAGSGPTTVWIASDRSVIAHKLVARLAQEADICVAGHCAPDAARVSVHAKQCQPDLLLFDTASLGPGEIQSLHLIRRAAPRMRLLLLIDQPRADTVEEILRNRFHGFLLADCPLDVYARAIRAIARGEIWIPRTLLANALSEVLDLISRGARPGEDDLATPSVPNPCTSREQQILELVRQGLTNKEIAFQLGIVEDTVKKHLQHVYDKLGVRRRTLAVLRRGRAGLSALPDNN